MDFTSKGGITRPGQLLINDALHRRLRVDFVPSPRRGSALIQNKIHRTVDLQTHVFVLNKEILLAAFYEIGCSDFEIEELVLIGTVHVAHCRAHLVLVILQTLIGIPTA